MHPRADGYVFSEQSRNKIDDGERELSFTKSIVSAEVQLVSIDHQSVHACISQFHQTSRLQCNASQQNANAAKDKS